MGRPKQPLISRSAATKAALDVIDEVGVNDFSLGAVAKRMGVKAPSLYYHFADKAELLSEVARSILGKTPYLMDPEGSWEDQTIELCIATRRALLAHANAAPLILQFFPRHMLLNAYENAVSIYPETRALHMAILEGIEKITFGSALFAAAARQSKRSAMPDVDPERHPHLAASIKENRFDEEGTFVEAIRMFIAGVRVRTDRS